MKSLLSLLLILGLTTACDKQQVYQGLCDDVIYESASDYIDGPYESSTIINSIFWNGDCLEISVSYSGGCQENKFEVVTDGTIIETEPPLIKLGLIHDDTDDCEAYITETISMGLGENTFLNDEDEIILNFTTPEFTYTLKK